MKRVEKHTRNVKSDVIFKEFWRNNERFADLFNAVVFGGREVIKPEILQEIDWDFERCFGKQADNRRKLSNGGMPCTLYQFFRN